MQLRCSTGCLILCVIVVLPLDLGHAARYADKGHTPRQSQVDCASMALLHTAFENAPIGDQSALRGRPSTKVDVTLANRTSQARRVSMRPSKISRFTI